MQSSSRATATFAAGCFWGTERFFKRQFGPQNADAGPVYSYSVGYMAGAMDTVPPRAENPGYKAVCRGDTGCAEVLQLEYDPTRIAYDDLVLHFFKTHEPTTLNRQHGDIGTQYRSAIMVHDTEQKAVAERVIAELTTGEPTAASRLPPAEIAANKAAFDKAFKGLPIVTTVEPATQYFPAEDYHQEYLDVNPDGYCSHRKYW